MSYYDVDAILTDGEKVPCQFDLDVPHLGHLDNSPGLKPGTKLSLPLWLAEMLALAAPSHNPSSSSTTTTTTTTYREDPRPPLTLNLPPCLSDPVLAALKADPRAVPLRDQSPHFYGVGVRMLDLFDEREVGGVLRRSFVLRGGEVGLHARKADEGAGAGGGAGAGRGGEEFLRGLDEWERALFRRGHRGMKEMREWMDRVKRS